MFDSDTILITNNPTILQAAIKNYGKFPIPINSVGFRKIARQYNNWHKANVDHLTSDNIIGEVINFSQELNSLFWHNIYSGQSFEYNNELYLDICKLDIMSRIEIDSAKKEFDIENRKELKNLKNKYASIQEAIGGKPLFFKMLGRLKGFDIGDKDFIQYQTPMDYLQQIINKHSSGRANRISQKDLLPLSAIFNTDDYRQIKVNYKQIVKIRELIHEYETSRVDIWSNSSLDNDTRYQMLIDLKENLINTISGMKINYHTTCRILKIIDSEKYNTLFRILFFIFYMSNNDIVSKIFEDSTESIPVLEECLPEEKEIGLFNFSYKYQK